MCKYTLLGSTEDKEDWTINDTIGEGNASEIRKELQKSNLQHFMLLKGHPIPDQIVEFGSKKDIHAGLQI